MVKYLLVGSLLPVADDADVEDDSRDVIGFVVERLLFDVRQQL